MAYEYIQSELKKLSELKKRCKEISETEFWESMEFAPIKRMGFSDGPGAVFQGEPQDLRVCSVSNEEVYTRNAHFVVKTATGVSTYYRVVDPITLEEFKAMCEVIIPRVGVCDGGYGRDL